MITSISFVLTSSNDKLPYRTYRDLNLFKDCVKLVQKVQTSKHNGDLEIGLKVSDDGFNSFIEYLQKIHREDRVLESVSTTSFAKQTSPQETEYLEELTESNKLREVLDIALLMGHPGLVKLIVAWMVHKSYKMDVNAIAKMLTFTTRFSQRQQAGLALEQHWCQ